MGSDLLLPLLCQERCNRWKGRGSVKNNHSGWKSDLLFVLRLHFYIILIQYYTDLIWEHTAFKLSFPHSSPEVSLPSAELKGSADSLLSGIWEMIHVRRTNFLKALFLMTLVWFWVWPGKWLNWGSWGDVVEGGMDQKQGPVLLTNIKNFTSLSGVLLTEANPCSLIPLTKPVLFPQFGSLSQERNWIIKKVNL